MIAQAAFLHAQPPHSHLPRLMRKGMGAWALRLQRLSLVLACASLLALPTLSFAQAAKPISAASASAASKPSSVAPRKPAAS
jgi:hypothetical protein